MRKIYVEIRSIIGRNDVVSTNNRPNFDVDIILFLLTVTLGRKSIYKFKIWMPDWLDGKISYTQKHNLLKRNIVTNILTFLNHIILNTVKICKIC